VTTTILQLETYLVITAVQNQCTG